MWTKNFQMFKLDLGKAEEPDHRKSKRIPKIIYFFIDYPKAFDCVDHIKLWEILKEMGIPDLLPCLLWNLYAGQEATVRTRQTLATVRTDWFQIGKGVCQGCILSPCLLNLYAEYIIWNAGLDESQAGIKTAKRNINLRYADVCVSPSVVSDCNPMDCSLCPWNSPG